MSNAKPMSTVDRRTNYHHQNNGGPLKPGQRRRLQHKKQRNIHHRTARILARNEVWRASSKPIDLGPVKQEQKVTYSLGRRGEVVQRTGPTPRRTLRDRFRLARRGRKGQ